jgi:hypothetical protein
MSENKLQKIEPGGAVAPPMDMESLFRAAMEKGPEIVERMVALRDKLCAQEAKRQFDEAMVSFQAECPIVTKTRGVRDNSGVLAYQYAPLERVIEVIRPCLQRHGFSYDLDTDTSSEQGWVIATCTAKHRGGHSETKRVKLPIGTGTRIMSTTQIYAAALSFASRRALQNAFGIVCAGEDKDGAEPGTKTKGPSVVRDQAGNAPTDAKKEAMAKLWHLLKPVRGTKRDWLEAEAWLDQHKIISREQTVADLTAEALQVVIEKSEIELNPK